MKNPKVDALFKPLQLGDIQIENRIIMASLTRMRCDKVTKSPNDLVVQFYTQRASAGLIMTESTFISERSQSWPGCPGIMDQTQVEGWKKVIESVHNKKGKIILQIWHSGRATHSKLQDGLQPWGPSAIEINGPHQILNIPHEIPHEMNLEEIQLVKNQFRKGAQLAKEAGFDAISLHGSNGYLIDQFLKSNSNKRQDEYGGSIEGRCKFCLEVIDELISVFGKGRVGIKVSPIGRFNDMYDNDPIKLFTYLFQELDKRQIAFIELMNDKDEENAYNHGLPSSQSQTQNLFEQLRNSFKGVIIGNVGLTGETAAQLIEAGIIDAASFGMPYISNPDLVERIRYNFPLTVANPDTFFEGDHVGYTDYLPYQQ
ncbi:unnamed protein product [Paramecium octaurelia]|uniref:NADH:flavin oxidoreductase/NADH oxidase N-terminal domain-containing protein n=1 Tax=Paramecium octaurelia TaxID=43137 RepID=A0A8S1S598_PAROT|nr:unnamed protein product [Paramecium octaurelia]